MKVVFFTFLSLMLSSIIIAQGVSISEEESGPDESAILDIQATDKGLLLPRMNSAERDGITNPAESLIIFNIDTKCFETYVYNQWNELFCAEDPGEPCEESVAPDGILGQAEICLGDDEILSVDGGMLGTGASWEWYSESCGGVSIGSGNNVTVSPDTETTYYVRAEGDCGITDCAEHTITINTAPEIPTAEAANSIGEEEFTANWQSSTGADSYILEVSENDTFTEMVYSNNVGNNTHQIVSGLNCETTYYYRVRAVNDCDESSNSLTILVITDDCATACEPISPCPGEGTVSYDGFTYNTVQIGDQCWFVENLRTTSGISHAPSDSEWSDAGQDMPYEPAYCDPDPNANNSDGYLYNWFAANDNPCPFGWRVPTESDFETLVTNANSVGDNLKDESPFWNGTNECGWAGRQGNYRAPSGSFWSGNVNDGFWWTTTPGSSSGYYIDFRLYDDFGNNYQINGWGSPRGNGAYIRCIKD